MPCLSGWEPAWDSPTGRWGLLCVLNHRLGTGTGVPPAAGQVSLSSLPPWSSMPSHATNLRLKLPATCFLLEILTILLFAVFVRYDREASASQWHQELNHRNTSHLDNDFYFRYPSKYRAPSPCRFLSGLPRVPSLTHVQMLQRRQGSSRDQAGILCNRGNFVLSP